MWISNPFLTLPNDLHSSKPSNRASLGIPVKGRPKSSYYENVQGVVERTFERVSLGKFFQKE